jgi:ribonuclease BN (tRNA processing enzyme)
LFVAHNSLPRGSDQYARMLYMPPWLIGQIAANAHVKLLVLSHRILETLGKEHQIQAEIRKRYSGPVQFANDLDCFPVR